MSLDKGIKHGKEHRVEYRGAKSYCKECRNHGSCDYCKGNRIFNNQKRIEKFKDLYDDFYQRK